MVLSAPHQGEMGRTRFVSMIAVFAAFTVVFDAVIIPQFSSGVWFGLVYLIEPITGIVLGPYAGFLSTLLGVIIGHTLNPRGVEEFLFTLGAPIGAMVSGMLFRKRWRLVFTYYTVLLISYFLTPVALQLPVWGMWDVYCAYIALIITLIMTRVQRDRIMPWNNGVLWSGLCAFIGLEADVLFRIFILIPGQTYHSIYALPIEILQSIWVAGALITPFKVALSTMVSAVVGAKLSRILFHNSERKNFSIT